MPLIFEEVVEKTHQVVGFICNVCKEKFAEDDHINMQEVLSWRNSCGYGSVWGDGVMIELTICQKCQVDLFAEYATFHGG